MYNAVSWLGTPNEFRHRRDADLQYSLKELRVRKGLSQKQLADKLGVSAATIVAWEKNPNKIQMYKLQAIADFYGVKLDEIFLGERA